MRTTPPVHRQGGAVGELIIFYVQKEKAGYQETPPPPGQESTASILQIKNSWVIRPSFLVGHIWGIPEIFEMKGEWAVLLSTAALE